MSVPLRRLFDITVAALSLVLLSPLLLPILLLIWRYDHSSPFYLAPRVGLGGREFIMVKLRSMVVDADRSGVDTTSQNDSRITPIGRVIRKYKLDELLQLWNVLVGAMSLVGPRPNVRREVNLYTAVEQKLLSVKPGVTDLASIVFADLGETLKDSTDPDIDYNQLIRPWKSRLSLLHIEHSSLLLDLAVLVLTAVSILSRDLALRGVGFILRYLGAEPRLIEVASRKIKLYPHPPPGSCQIVTSRQS